jgi:hypothetical protein
MAKFTHEQPRKGTRTWARTQSRTWAAGAVGQLVKRAVRQ